ncbi:RNA-splicing ligase RtcB [Candidatus Epulonipiscium fishelsonii]|uniref:RNA-splicing ligase RtcB n=1 Tax=Candidatus Epulonipiscium fishelsonii TaxID=77094 RepID=A0ACC8X9U3_9FIRM|nr:RNA-splicing ligase RtcB [Epulopiscium sp. SCG-B11WGA-EpuloA1]ONI41713.1 RNA-splicing ligase RtcB [Epulopiscium sp. SCG-B05WGA-EpuloA1]
MLTIEGKYTTAKVFTDNIQQEAISQIYEVCNNLIAEYSNIAIMPDVHAGKGCTIGTTMSISNKIVPNLVGVDIGCGVRVQPIKVQKGFDWINEFDKKLRATIPSGTKIRDNEHPFLEHIPLDTLRCPAIKRTRADKSVGTLGGGNHYIEVNYDEDGQYYLTVHSGSRYLGKQIAEFYQGLAYDTLNNNKTEQSKEVEKAIQLLQKSNQTHLIESTIREIKEKYARNIKVSRDLAYLEGKFMDDYLHDMHVATVYAYWNRKAIAYSIIKALNGRIDFDNKKDAFDTVHNYIDIENKILRKGAVSAQKDEILIIPINMRDGSIIARGKGNPEWNFSAPHGAGRIMSRTVSKQNVTLNMFKKSMEGIYTTSVNSATIDESCFAYKDMQEILDNIGDTVDIIKIIKPIYNFKAS